VADLLVRNGHVGRPDAAPDLGHVEWRARTSLIAGLCPATPLSYINSLVARNSSNAPANAQASAQASALANAVIVDPLCKMDEL
jgi:hypothetical protein